MNTLEENIQNYSKELKLPVFRRDFKELAGEAARNRLDYEAYLLQLLEREYENRLENRKKAQIRQAGFPAKMYLTGLERGALVSCTISNVGYWPDPDNPQRLFELYWRGPGTAGQAGLGIGLYMARVLARLQIGELDTCHQIPDRVSFILELPHISTQYARQDPS